jgi:hypothetical protein
VNERELRRRLAALDGASTTADWADVRARVKQHHRPHRWLALGVALALVAVGAAAAVGGNVFDLFQSTDRPALPRTIFPPLMRAEYDQRYGHWSVQEVGKDSKSAFYAMKDGRGRIVCVGSGPAKPREPDRVIGSLSCPAGREYLSQKRPLYYEVVAEATRENPTPHPWRLRGVAVEGIARIAVVNPEGDRTEAQVEDHVFTLTEFPTGAVFRIEALDGDGEVVAEEDLEGFGPAQASLNRQRATMPTGPVSNTPTQRPFPALPRGSAVVQQASDEDATVRVYANGLVSLRVSPSAPAARIVRAKVVSIVCYRRVVVDGISHMFGTGTATARSGLELRGKIASHRLPVARAHFEGCGISTMFGRRWNDPRGMHLLVEVALTPRGRQFFAEQAAARDLAFFVRSKHIVPLRRALKRDADARLPQARTIVAPLPSRVIALSRATGAVKAGQIGVWSEGRTLVLVTKAADGRRFSVVLRNGRVTEQHLGGITSAF